MKYTIKQLEKLRDIYALNLDDDDKDELYTTNRGFFFIEACKFFSWLIEMESENKINELLESEVNYDLFSERHKSLVVYNLKLNESRNGI